MNTILELIAIVGGGIGSLVAYKIVPLDRFVEPGEAAIWYEKYGKLFRILFPAALIIGLVLLLF
ncbi:MAG: hypothetical protein JW749_09660 [Sedimentisphaerales bacterium]|nr:hypothetical protein [Sedimentisphaerales bacterium]